MKKLSVAIVLIATGVTFANAQSKEAPQKTAKVEAATKAEIAAKAEVKADTAVLAPAEVEIKTAPVESEKAELRKDVPLDKQKARVEKKQVEKVE